MEGCAARGLGRRAAGGVVGVNFAPHGPIAQLVERLAGSQEVRGSNPLGSTFGRAIRTIYLRVLLLLFFTCGHRDGTSTPGSNLIRPSPGMYT